MTNKFVNINNYTIFVLSKLSNMNITSFKKEFKFRLLGDGKYYTTYVFTPSAGSNYPGNIAKADGTYVCVVNEVKSTGFEWTAHVLRKGFAGVTMFAECEIIAP